MALRLPKFVLDITSGLTDRFPWGTPTKARVEAGEDVLFPETITNSELINRFQRYQLVKVIISDVAEDAVRNGFIAESTADPGNEDFNNDFQRIYGSFLAAPFLKTLKYCRFYGHSELYFGYGDRETGNLANPPNGDPFPYIKKLIPLYPAQFDLSVTDYLPIEVSSIRIHFSEGSEEEDKLIYRSRFIHFENESFIEDRRGMSVLSPVWDLLTVQKHADWSIGQDMWRGAAGLLTLFAPPGTESADALSALKAIDNINAKSRLVLPPGFDAKDLSPARTAYNVRHSYEILVRQIAAGTRIPVSALLRKQTTKIDPEYEGFLYSMQKTFIEPLLREAFLKFQETTQLTEGDFKIIWKPAAESPYAETEASSIYMKALAEKFKREKEATTP